MKLKKWAGLLLVMLILCVANIHIANAQETSNQISDKQNYGVEFESASPIPEEVYINPMYKDTNVQFSDSNTFENKQPLAGSGQTFSSVSDAGKYLRDAMVKRQTSVTFIINKGYYSGLAHDIFNYAVDENNASGSSQGDYLYSNFSGYEVSGYSSSTKSLITYKMEYLSTYDQEQQVNSAVRSVLSSLNVSNKDDYTKVKAVHDYIVKNIKYDDSLANHSTYNAIVEKNVVCQGFASLTYKMLKELKVGVRYITGNDSTHAWNIAKVNGKWYNVDNTWDENLTAEYSTVSYVFFLKNNSDFIDHTRDAEYNDSSFNSKYPMAQTSYSVDSTGTTGVAVTSVSLNKKSLNLKIGQTDSLSAKVSPSNADNKDVTWSSNNTSVVTVDANGSVAAIGAGTATITCTAKDGSGKSATCSVKVIDGKVKVSSISLNQRNLNLVIGKTSTIVARISPSKATNKEVTWTSSDENVATVDKNGTVTAVGVGTAKITCTATDGSGKTATATVKVTDGKIKVKSLTLNKTSLSLTAGSTSTLIARISPSNATDKEVTWTSSDESIATVDENGKVTAVSAGTVTITCRANDGSEKYSTCVIIVK